MKTGRYFLLAMVAFLLCSCGTSMPYRTGLNLYDTSIPSKSGDTDIVVEAVTNAAAAIAEPYPTQNLQVIRPAPEPEKMVLARKEVEALELKLLSLKKDTEEYNSTLSNFQKANDRYKEYLHDWSSQEPKKVVIAKMVSIDFKDSEGKIVEITKNGKLIFPKEKLDSIKPFYGGVKRTIIRNARLKDYQDCLFTIHSNDKSESKRVYRLDGKGVMGEKWGTPYVYYNPQIHGDKIGSGNMRIYEIKTGTEKYSEIDNWVNELALKTLVVSFRGDAIEALNHPKLAGYRGYALDPMAKNYVERMTSRSHAVMQYISDLAGVTLNTAGVAVFYDVLRSRGLSLGVTAFSGIIFRLFGEKENYLFGSFGTSVKTIDFVISRLEVEESIKNLSGGAERNEIVTRFNDASSVCQFELADAVKRQEACNLMKSIANEWRQKAGFPVLK